MDESLQQRDKDADARRLLAFASFGVPLVADVVAVYWRTRGGVSPLHLAQALFTLYPGWTMVDQRLQRGIWGP